MDIKIKFGISAFIIILIQSALKLIGVLITGSLSFLSESVDTITDIFFVSLTIYSLFQSQKPPDYEHMYGHTKIDSLGGLVQGIVLICLYFFLIINAFQAIINQSFMIVAPDTGFQIIVTSFIINLIFSRILIWQGKKRSSLTLEIQGLNLFQDSMRAIIVILNFIFALFFNIQYLDPVFSIIISIWIIFSAVKLSKDGIEDLIDVNPINQVILEEMKQKIFNLDHVNGVEELKVRAISSEMFFEVHLAVEDHISIIHANEITKAIQSMCKLYFPSYKVEVVVEMNPLAGEPSLGEKILNLLHSMKSEFHEIVDFKDLNIFRIEKNYFLSLSMVVDDNLSLESAHEISNKFEKELKEQVPIIYRIITHIESEAIMKKGSTKHLVCKSFEPEELEEIKTKLEKILRKRPEVKGYHGLECWSTPDYCILELHIFFEGSLNISIVHNIITALEKKVKEEINIKELQEIIFHSEPIAGRTDGIIF